MDIKLHFKGIVHIIILLLVSEEVYGNDVDRLQGACHMTSFNAFYSN